METEHFSGMLSAKPRSRDTSVFWEAEVGSSQVGSQPGQHSEFEDSLDYIARLFETQEPGLGVHACGPST